MKKLNQHLTQFDLTALGVAAIIGAGIFSTVGNAAAQGGPAVSLLFVFTAFACGLSALCYAQFASSLPSAGSAYSYARHIFGPLVGWIIGWDLIMEYAIGNIAVAISWSDYFTSLLHNVNIHVPEYLSTDYLSASRSANSIKDWKVANSGQPISASLLEASKAWNNAPALFGNLKIILDLPAMLITVFITWLTYIGIKESKNFNNGLVIFKLLVLLLVIVMGIQFINVDNWIPFAPNGLSGVASGVSSVFFAYIGFDAISTTAEECKNPQKDIPRAMFWALGICTVLYVVITLVLTGMVPYSTLSVGDPLAFVFNTNKLYWVGSVVAISALFAYTGVLLVFQIGQPRIWYSMSKDGLLPTIFSSIHEKYATPWFATIVAGLLVGIPSMFMNLVEVTDLTSIGTLFAFGMVCLGILESEQNEVLKNAKFKVPYFNSLYFNPILLLILIFVWVNNEFSINYQITFGVITGLLLWGMLKKWSLLPLIGLICNVLLLGTLGGTNWMRFLIWLAIGLAIYWFYGRKRIGSSQ